MILFRHYPIQLNAFIKNLINRLKGKTRLNNQKPIKRWFVKKIVTITSYLVIELNNLIAVIESDSKKVI